VVSNAWAVSMSDNAGPSSPWSTFSRIRARKSLQAAALPTRISVNPSYGAA
jgi:hypothetical protein